MDLNIKTVMNNRLQEKAGNLTKWAVIGISITLYYGVPG